MLCFCQGSRWPGTAGWSFSTERINMHALTKKSLFSAAVCALLAAAPAKATIYDEAVSGDLSNDKGAPTALTLTPGFNSVSGTVAGFPQFGGIDPQDWVSFTIPAGFVMTSYVNAKYISADDQGFTGFQSGSSFTGDEFMAGESFGSPPSCDTAAHP